MKNIRKIVAIMAAALMLFSVLPMSAFAADGDAVWSVDFNDGEKKFNDGEVVNEGPDGSGCLKWSATGGWSSTYAVAKGFEANTDYTVTMMVKANVDGSMGTTIQNGDWGDYMNGPAFEVTTEWKEAVVTFNSAAYPTDGGIILFKFQDVGVALDLYVDNIVISKGLPKLPIITNGDFEEGTIAPWTVHQQASATAEAAYEGGFGAHLKGNGTWGGIMDTTLNVTAGKAYELSFWIKVNKTGINLQIKDGDASGASLASGTWYDKNAHSEWTQKTYVLTPSTNGVFLNFCGAGNGTPNPDMEEDVYIDNIKVRELKDPSFDGYITNGDFETGDAQSWESVWNSAQISMVEGGHDSDYAMQINYPGQWQIVRQKVNVEPNTDYVFGVYAKDNNGAVLLVKDGNDSGNIKQGGIASGSEWKKNSIEFNSGSYNQVFLCVMSNNADDSVIVDDFFLFEKVEASDDGYLVNGTFETGDIAPWENLWGSCPKAEVVKGGYNDSFSLDIVSGEWKHVRQTNIAVEANTEYKISVYAKNVKNMNLLVKDGADTTNLANVGANGGDEWTLNEITFNSGANTSVLVSFMGGAEEAYGSFDNIAMEKVVADHVCEFAGEMTLEATCDLTGEMTYTCKCGKSYVEEIPAYHNGHLTYVPAVEAIDCANPGHIEYYTCPWCHEFFTDINASEYINPWFIEIAMDCVKPEGLADCANWICKTCGEENVGAGEHDVMACQGGICFKCDAEVAGYGCANYATPACEDGECYYCGGFVAGLGHENGTMYPCLDGECAYGCGMIFPATEDHVDEDGNDICDNCYNCVDEHTFASFDPCYGGECLVCFTYVEGNHVLKRTALKNADCAAAGNLEYWSCSVCNSMWLDKDCTEVTTPDDVILAQKDHEALYACDQYCMYCGEKKFPRAKHAILHVEAMDATCLVPGNVEYWYCKHCNTVALDDGLMDQTNMMNVKIFLDHTLDNECDTDCNVCGTVVEPWHVREYDCSDVCSACGAQVEPHYPHLFEYVCSVRCAECGINNPDVVDHNYVNGFCTECSEMDPYACIHEYWYPCDQYCMLCLELTNPDATHSYDDDADLDCNFCGEIREVEITIVVLTHTGVSVSEDVNGLAFSFAMNVSDATVQNFNQFVSGLVNPFGTGDLPLLSMGAIVSNMPNAQLDLENVDGAKIKNVTAKYLLDANGTDGQIAFAVRIINIPAAGKSVDISARPYFACEVDGVECIFYGDIVVDSYQNVQNG